MIDRELVIDAVRDIVERVAGSARTPAGHVNGDTPLTESGWWLDSVELLEVIVSCEVEFAITFEPSRDLRDDALRTLGTLAAMIQAKNPELSRA